MKKALCVALVAAIALPAFAQTLHGSARVLVTGQPNENEVFMFDATGALTGSYPEIAGARTDAWGYRDGTTDGTHVYFGWGGGVARHNADGSGGVLHIAGAAPGGVGTWRALAYDPTGDGGAGSLWTASFGSDLIEVDMAGGILTTFTNPTVPWSLYGLAMDHATGNLWGHSRTGTGDAELIEIDTTTGTIIGAPINTSFGWPGSSVPGAHAIQGGLSMFDGSGLLYSVLQGTPDAMAQFDTSGTLTGALAPNPLDVEALTGSNGHLGIAVIPEPATLVLLSLGALALLRRYS